MKNKQLYYKSQEYLNELCVNIVERSVGSRGNQKATKFFAKAIGALGWQIEMPEFKVLDWEDEGATLQKGGKKFKVQVSPYSPGCDLERILIDANNIDELAETNVKDKILLLHGEIAREQLMPKNFVFYNPERHQKIITLLEEKQPAAIITATGKNAALAGGVYPFPMIEDGDFDIPSVYMTEKEGRKLLSLTGKKIKLRSISRRIPSTAHNVIARSGKPFNPGIVITAHIDAKKGSPGAIDNATGIVVLLLLAELLEGYKGENRIAIVAFNGEDYYSVPGQMNYITKNQGKFDEIGLNINIDGAGYRKGKSQFSFYDLPEGIEKMIKNVINKYEEIEEGPQWVQGDHSIFIQHGCPAIAISSQWFIENIDSQDITHTPKDNISIVDSYRLVEIAKALNDFIRKLPKVSK